MTTLVETPPNPFGGSVLNGPADYQPEWDVPSIGCRPTGALMAALKTLDGRLHVDSEQRIHVLLGPPGYGKTHLFGRLGHQLGERVFFVFVPQIQDLRRPLAHIRYHVVMNLFTAVKNQRSQLARMLATLSRPSFVAYLSALPRPLDARYEALLERLRVDETAVWEIVEKVDSVPAFQRMGDSLAALFPHLDGNVLRALALGWSPEKDYACRWLRGESIAEEHARRISLPDDAPDPVSVIRSVAVIGACRGPLVLCIDQLEALLAERGSAPLQLSKDIQTLREEVPNLLIVLSCIKDRWAELSNDFLASFLDRHAKHELELLSLREAQDLIHRRLSYWPGAPDGRSPWWPIDEASLQAWLRAESLIRPRALLLTCKARYDEWAENGNLGQLIRFGSTGATDPLVEFRAEWDKALAQAALAKERGPENVQDQRLARAFKEGLKLMADARGTRAAAVSPKTVHDDPIPQVAGNPDPYRYSFEVALKGRDGECRILIALEVNHNTKKFSYYFTAIIDNAQPPTIGAVLITAKRQVPAGPATKKEMETQIKENRLRVVFLPDYSDDFICLDCYLSLLDRALAQDLNLGGATMSAAEYRELVARAGVLANLRLFDRILDGWLPESDGAVPEPSAKRSGTRASTTAATRGVTTRPADNVGQASGARLSAAPPPATPVPASADARNAVDPLAEERLLWAADGQDLVTKRLSELGARVRPVGSVQIGPTFARFLVTPYPATTITKIRSRAEDLKVGLGVDALPVVNSQAGAVSVDVQLPERFRRTVRLSALDARPTDGAPVFPMGQDVTGENHWLDLSDPNTCHLLIAGTTGSGKSEFLKAMVTALARRLGPTRICFALVDPKQVTFNFGGRQGRFLVRPVANSPDETISVVKECFAEAERRFAALKDRQLEDLAQWQVIDPNAPPRLVLVFDEYADLMADRESKKLLEGPLKRLGAKARAAGIHVVLTTQRPEATVVTTLLRSNLPARVCFRVASAADSKLILKSPDGADLLGRGDLIWQRGAGSVRLQSPYVERRELEAALFSGHGPA